jgi:hypothetical protein
VDKYSDHTRDKIPVQVEESGMGGTKCHTRQLYLGPIIDSGEVSLFVILPDTNEDDWTLWFGKVSCRHLATIADQGGRHLLKNKKVSTPV